MEIDATNASVGMYSSRCIYLEVNTHNLSIRFIPRNVCTKDGRFKVKLKLAGAQAELTKKFHMTLRRQKIK